MNTPFVLTNTGNGPSVFTGTCEAATGPEKVFVYDNPFSARLTFSVNHPETIARTNVYIREACADGTSELACDVGEAPEQKGTATIPAAPPGRYFVFVDHPFGLGGQVKLSLLSERLDPGCADGLDNDQDGLVDADDLGCSSLLDEDERDPEFADGIFLPAQMALMMMKTDYLTILKTPAAKRRAMIQKMIQRLLLSAVTALMMTVTARSTIHPMTAAHRLQTPLKRGPIDHLNAVIESMMTKMASPTIRSTQDVQRPAT